MKIADNMWLRLPHLWAIVSASALILVALSCTEAGAQLFVIPLENRTAPLSASRDTGAQAIVVLGGDATTLTRIEYAAKLYRETRLPVLVSGGGPNRSVHSEAAVMAQILREKLSTPVKWLEEDSLNTAENAHFSAEILKKAGVQRIILVTHAIHMPRASAMFAQSGIEVVAAPVAFFTRDQLTFIDFLPSREGLDHAEYAFHEWIGIFWYWVRYGA